MTQFKVGDRVRDIVDGDEGTVTGIQDDRIIVDWKITGIVEGYEGEMELAEEQTIREHYGKQPNRTYYEEQDSARDYDQAEPTPFATNVHRILDGVANTVIGKNASYGDSALNPIRVFSKADRMEQLFVRLDDKLSRVQRGSEYPGDDTLRDIIGYATLILIARESE